MMPTPCAPGLRLLVAPNPSPLTAQGTNTWLVGTTGIAVIDPGPDSDAHLAAMVCAIGRRQHVTHVIVTHSHLDHSASAARVAAHFNAPILAFGDACAGRSLAMSGLGEQQLAALGGGEGLDHGFAPNRLLSDQEVIEGRDWHLTTWHTPGHCGNHLCLESPEGWWLTGDHAMAWSTSLISPPDGDMKDYRASCARMLHRLAGKGRSDRAVTGFPGHGPPIPDLAGRLRGLLTHRRAREQAILAALRHGSTDVSGLTRQVYHDVGPDLQIFAERNLLAHLLELWNAGAVVCDNDVSASAHPGMDACFALAPG